MTYESKDQKGKVHPNEQEKSATPVSVEQQKGKSVSPETKTPGSEKETSRQSTELRGGDRTELKITESEKTEKEHQHEYTPITAEVKTPRAEK